MLCKRSTMLCVASGCCSRSKSWISPAALYLTSHEKVCLKANEKPCAQCPACESSRNVVHSSNVCHRKLSTRSAKMYHNMTLETSEATFEKARRIKKLLETTVRHLQKALVSVAESMTQIQATNSTSKPYSSIPGPKGLPFLGSALEYTFLGPFSPKEYDKALRHRHNRYGKIFRERLLNQEFIYVSDPKDIRLLVQNESASPCRPHLDAIVESRNQEGLPIGITAMQGKEWQRSRNAINPAISIPKVVKNYRFAQKKIAQDLITHIKERRNRNTGEVQEFDQTLNRWALESIAVALLDTRLGLLTPGSVKLNPAAERLRECMDVFFDYGARLTFGMPTWKLWNTKDWKIFRNSQRDEFKYAGYFVEKKLKELNSNGCPMKSAQTETSGCPVHHHNKNKTTDNKSFSCLLDHVINNSELSKEEAVTVCLELLAGGIDTTATAAVFTLYHLAVNKSHQTHLRNLLKFDEAENSDLKEYNRDRSEFSKYLKASVWESMRLNPLTYANVRTTEKDLVFSGYFVPSGTVVRYDSHLMNLENEEYFLEPKKFIPERWMDRNSPYRCKEQFTFTPFGHGARQCPGRRVAEQELDLLFREILKSFEIGYKHEKMGNKVRLFNRADKPARFDFTPMK